MRLVHRQRSHFMREIVAETCRLVEARDDVRSVRIVGQGRPSYAEMRYYRQAAHDGHVRLAVDGAGTLTLRPPAAPGSCRWSMPPGKRCLWEPPDG
jgi:hypothetical protein